MPFLLLTFFFSSFSAKKFTFLGSNYCSTWYDFGFQINDMKKLYFTSEWIFLSSQNHCNIAKIFTMKTHCTIVPLIKLSMVKIWRIEHEQRAQGTNMQLMHIKLNIFFIFLSNIAKIQILHNAKNILLKIQQLQAISKE